MLFAAHLNDMRMSAIKDNLQYRVEVTDWDSSLTDVNVPSVGAWKLEAGNKAADSTSWDVLPVELNDVTGTGDGTIQISKGGTNELPWVSLKEPTTKTVTFSPRGWCDNPATDFVDDGGYMTFVFVNKRESIASGTDTWTVRVSRGGIVRVEANKNQWVIKNTVGTEATGWPSSAPTGYLGGH